MTAFKAISLRLVVFLSLALLGRAAEITNPTPAQVFSSVLNNLADIIEPPEGTPPRTFTATLKVVKAEGWPKSAVGQSARLAYQAPDRITATATVEGKAYSLGRNQQQLWLHAAAKKFGVVGLPGVAKFASAPDKLDSTRLGDLKLPLPREQLNLLALAMDAETPTTETIEGVSCRVLHLTPRSEALGLLNLSPFRLRIWVRDTDQLPARISYSDGKKINVDVEVQQPTLGAPWTDNQWKIRAAAGDKIETTALVHLSRFANIAVAMLENKWPAPLGPATGERRVVATEGQGRLERIDGTRVLFVKGTPEEMGQQHGKLLRREIRRVVDRILYGVGVGSSFEKGRWFFGEIEEAQGRLAQFMDPRYVREMDAIAAASGCEKEEVRLANYFPELFHCSGFAVFGEATHGGKLYHGRILDYLRGVGLEQNAVVIVSQPDQGNAWVNVSYAGFVGSVTAMNEKHVAIGEMGGRGEGQWDGKPMAQLVREVMEKADTIDEAVAIMRQGPRTCEYYYVISDAKSKRAVGIASTPTKFETVWAGEAHPRLPHAIKDAVLMSAGDRYENLVKRVKENYGKLDAQGARDLMSRPVAMNSNIHSVLFEPETLDFWVANADAKNVASHTRYTRYNLKELLQAPAPETKQPSR